MRNSAHKINFGPEVSDPKSNVMMFLNKPIFKPKAPKKRSLNDMRHGIIVAEPDKPKF